MGLFDRLLSIFSNRSIEESPRPDADADARTVRTEQPGTTSRTLLVTSRVEVSSVEVAERKASYAFVPSNELPDLKPADAWWNEDVHKRRRREESEKAYAWLTPFVTLEIARLPQLQPAQEWGPNSVAGLAKELRSIIREHRKANQPHDDLLRALYGVGVAADLAQSIAFEGVRPHYMARFVDLTELQSVKLDYPAMGYQLIESLSKTDVKWLVEAFGEPAEHQSVEALWPTVRRNAISRYCWKELRSRNDSNKSLGLPQQSMDGWLGELVGRNIGYHKEWQERVAARKAYVAELATVLETSWSATRQEFVVADLETTGLNASTDEVLELAAVRVAFDGTVLEEFTRLVRVSHVPAEITRLTGITQELVSSDGQSLASAMSGFARFAGNLPLFFHNAPFDQGFLAKAGAQTKVKLPNSVHDTLPLARQAWPSLKSYKLSELAVHVGATAPTHRAMADVKAALAVLLAAREQVARTSGRPAA